MTISLVGSPSTQRSTTATVTLATWAQTPVAGNLLVAVIGGGGSTAAAWNVAQATGTTGWARLIPAAVGNSVSGMDNAGTDIWYKVAGAAEAKPGFTATVAGTLASELAVLELSGAGANPVLDTSGTFMSGTTSGTLSSMTATTAGNVAGGGEFAVSAFTQERTATTMTWTESGSGWTSAFSDGATSSRVHIQVNFKAGPASGAALNDAGHFSTDTSAFGAGVVAVIKPGPVPVSDSDSSGGAGPAVTSLTSGALTSATQPTTLTTASVTPGAGRLTLLWVGYQSVSATNISSVTGLGATWSNVVIRSGNTDCYIELWWCVAVSAGTITITSTAGFDSAAWDVDQVTGVSTSSPFVTANTSSAFNLASSTAVTLAFSQAAAAGNILAAALSWSVSGSTFSHSSGWAGVADASGIGTFFSQIDTAWNPAPGAGTPAITWTASGSGDKAPTIGVELVAAATGEDGGEAIRVSSTDSGTSQELALGFGGDFGSGADGGETIILPAAPVLPALHQAQVPASWKARYRHWDQPALLATVMPPVPPVLLSDSDASAAAEGAGVLREDFGTPPANLLSYPPAFQAAFMHQARPFLTQGNLPQAVSDGDTGHGTDAGEGIAAALSSPDTVHGADGGESVQASLSSQDAAGSTDQGTTVGLGAADAGTGTDGGESVPAALSSSDTGHGAGAGESIALSSQDTGHGTDTGESIQAALASQDAAGSTGHGTDAGEGTAAALSSPDAATGADGGERILLAAADIGQGTDGGEGTAAALSSPDSGTGADGGEQVQRADFHRLSGIPPAWQARYRHTRRPVLPLASGLPPLPVVPDTDAGTGTDGGESVTASLSAAEAGTGTDAGEGTQAALASQDAAGSTDQGTTVGVGAADTSGTAADSGTVQASVPSQDQAGGAQDGGEAVQAVLSAAGAGQGSDAGESVTVSLASTDAGTVTGDGGEQLGAADFSLGQALRAPSWLAAYRHVTRPVTPLGAPPPSAVLVSDSESGLGEDSEIDNPGALDSDTASGADGESIAVHLRAADTGSGRDAGEALGGIQLVSSADTGRGTDAGGWSGPLADTDTGTGSDREVTRRVLADSDSSSAADAHIVDVYTFQPPFRWTGGQFEAPYRPEHAPQAPPRPPGNLRVTLDVSPALRVILGVSQENR